MKEFDCLEARVVQLEVSISEAAHDANVTIVSESVIYSVEQLNESEAVASLSILLTSDSDKQISATIEVIYDYFGFVGIHMLPSEECKRLGVKQRRAKGSLKRVIKSFINQLIATEEFDQESSCVSEFKM